MNITEFTPDEVENPTSPEQHMMAILAAFSHVAHVSGINVPTDYLEYSLKAMKNLNEWTIQCAR